MSRPLDATIFDLCTFNDGFYIECGANNGVDQSNTIRLEKEKGWGGILIDASPSAMEKCKQNRNPLKNIFVTAALSSPEKEGSTVNGSFTGDCRGEIGRGGIPATCITLTTILTEHKIQKVDLLVLDIQGYELDALKGLDFQLWSPPLVVVEIIGDKTPVFSYMKDKGYSDGENISKFNKAETPSWNGTHDDYLFRKGA